MESFHSVDYNNKEVGGHISGPFKKIYFCPVVPTWPP